MFAKNFPIFKRRMNSRHLVYLDNASTTQKPEVMIRAISDFYNLHNANIHRGIHTLSQEATTLYENARDKVQKFINAGSREEIIFTSGATEAINLVVWTWGHENIHAGDEILLTEMEHHSNIVPWQILAKKKRAKVRYIPLQYYPRPSRERDRRYSGGVRGRLDLSKLSKLITRRTKLLSLTHVSNVLGTINPIQKIIRAAHAHGAKVLIDGAQAGAHLPIDVQKLDADFYALAGHKMYGPTGVGVLYGKKELFESMPPYQAGGHMIKKVNFKSSTWAELPYKFEAGTQNISAVIGLGAAVDFLSLLMSHSTLLKHESALTSYALKELNTISGLTIYGPQNDTDRVGAISFNINGIPPHDLASILDSRGIAIRTGHHCAMPLHEKLGVESSARISLAVYNTKDDIDKLIAGIKSAQRLLSPPREGETKRGSRSKKR